MHKSLHSLNHSFDMRLNHLGPNALFSTLIPFQIAQLKAAAVAAEAGSYYPWFAHMAGNIFLTMLLESMEVCETTEGRVEIKTKEVSRTESWEKNYEI